MQTLFTYDSTAHFVHFAYKYTGKERDAESGNDYFGARYYASSMGRFLSPDWSDDPDSVPFADLGDPQSLNLYAYVANNPLSGTDADGHVRSWDLWWSGSGSGGHTGSMCDFGMSEFCEDESYAQLPQMPYDVGSYDSSTTGGMGFFRCTTCHDPSPAIIQGQREADMQNAFIYAFVSLEWNMFLKPRNPFASARNASAQSTPADPDNKGGGNGRKKWNITPSEKKTVGGRTYLKDGNTGYWWSRDTAGHGGSVWKVYEEGPGSSFRWIADADEYGDYIVNKWKSPAGMTVKY